MEILAIIPARGGSKGLPKKNIMPISGKPLIAHSIEHAISSELVTKVLVSTDSLEISEISQEYGAEIIMRPEKISGDTATSESALTHTLKTYLADSVKFPDLVVFLQCTSPIRKKDDIDQAIKKLLEEKADSLLSVTRFHHFIWNNNFKGASSINYNFRKRPRRQDREAEFLENGSIYIFKPEILLKQENRLGGKIALYEMDYWSSFEIDSRKDFLLCDWILQNQETLII